jgi:sec-independent protein translocase protein TatA
MLGGPGLLVIAGIALVVFGPKKLAELAKTFGGLMGEFKKTTEEMKESIGMNDLQNVTGNLTPMDLLTDIAEKVSASMNSEEATGEAPVDKKNSPPVERSGYIGDGDKLEGEKSNH